MMHEDDILEELRLLRQYIGSAIKATNDMGKTPLVLTTIYERVERLEELIRG